MEIQATGELGSSAAERDHYYKMYEWIFKGVNRRAALRHLMTRSEFEDVSLDPLITKWIGLAEEGVGGAVALGMSTPHLGRVPLISAPFYRDKYGYRALVDLRVWYVLFIGVDTAHAPVGAYPEILKAMAEPIRAVNGVAVLDMCAFNYNEDGRDLGGTTTKILRREYGDDLGQHVDDTQTFMAYDFRDL